MIGVAFFCVIELVWKIKVNTNCKSSVTNLANKLVSLEADKLLICWKYVGISQGVWWYMGGSVDCGCAGGFVLVCVCCVIRGPMNGY